MTLSDLQLKAIFRYISGGYVDINGDCRGDCDGGPEVHFDIYQLDTAIEAAALERDQILYRGVDSSYVRELERRGVRVGDVLVDRAFLSTSLNEAVATRFLGHEPGGALLRIDIRTGMRALDLAPYSETSDEQEYLLPRDTRMLVVGYDHAANVLELEVIDHG